MKEPPNSDVLQLDRGSTRFILAKFGEEILTEFNCKWVSDRQTEKSPRALRVASPRHRVEVVSMQVLRVRDIGIFHGAGVGDALGGKPHESRKIRQFCLVR